MVLNLFYLQSQILNLKVVEQQSNNRNKIATNKLKHELRTAYVFKLVLHNISGAEFYISTSHQPIVAGFIRALYSAKNKKQK